ncbi:MAG: virulence factor SrfB, partial [Tannerella sp.]|nr:virulence factor SrfB [Tannerella sp.]
MTDKYTLIANSGIQFLKVEMELNPNDNIVRALRFYDHKQYDRRMFQTSYFLERAEYLANQDVWVTYGSLVREGCINEKTGKIIEEKINLDDLDKIENDEEKLSINSFETNIQKSLYRDKTAIEHIENKWLPIPFFEKSEDGKSTFGATNWARMFLSPKKVSGGKKGSRFYDVILAFDTCALSGDEDQKWEYPWFSSRDVKKTFAMCSDLENLFNYVNTKECSWVDDYLFKLFHGGDWDVLTALDSGFSKYKAYYIYIMYYLAMKGGLPEVVLFNDKSNDAEQVKVDLVLDIGNSRTCGLLFEDSDFTKVSMLELQDMTHPERSYCDPFDMRLAFREAIFGEIIVQYNNQFTWSSILRVGEEASWLIYNTKNTDNDGAEKVTHYSSPKRYLWDSEQFKKQWEYILLEGEERNQRNSDIHIDGITTQFHNDGTFCRKPMDVGSSSSFSRQALSTFVFLEILSQAQRQANSHEFREKHGQISYPRRINRIIITCPTAMTREEQIRLRRCAEEASLVLRRFIDGTYNTEYDPKHDKSKVQIVPSVKELSYDLQSIDLKQEWGFDEATCCQLVYIYAEVSKRYLNNCREYFDLYGKKRNDLDDYDKKSIT